MGKMFTTSFSVGVNDITGMKWDWYDFVLNIAQYMNLKLLRFFAIGGMSNIGTNKVNELELFNKFWQQRFHQHVHEGDIVSVSYLYFTPQGDPNDWLRMRLDVWEHNDNIKYVRISLHDGDADHYYITPYGDNDQVVSVNHKTVVLYANSGNISVSNYSTSSIKLPISNGALAEVSYLGAGPFYDKWHDEWVDTSVGECYNTYFFLKSRQVPYEPGETTPGEGEESLPSPGPIEAPPEEPEGEVTPG